MEQFSNEINAIRQRAKQELLENTFNTYILYSEIPHFSSEFSVSIKKNDTEALEITTKWWDKHDDIQKYHQLGLLNLDRLRILEKTRILTVVEKDLLQNILEELELVELPNSIENKEVIVLDGCEYELILNTKNIQKIYNWRIANHNYVVIEKIIRFLVENSNLQKFQDMK
jgi:hypothetical protein